MKSQKHLVAFLFWNILVLGGVLICTTGWITAGKKNAIASVLRQWEHIVQNAPDADVKIPSIGIAGLWPKEIGILSKRFYYVASHAREIDLSDCPNDFAGEFIKMRKALYNANNSLVEMKALKKQDEDSGFWGTLDKLVKGELSEYVKDFHAKQDRINEDWIDAVKAYRTALDNVKSIAEKYGVEP